MVQSLLYQYLVSGIASSGIVEDGGPICARQIPLPFKYTVQVLSVIIYLWLCYKIKHQCKFSLETSRTQPSRFEYLYGITSILTILIQTYMKVSTKKGMFMFNPCHINLFFVSTLVLLPTTRTTKLIHIAWEPWVFGPLFSLLFPHLYGISQFEIYLYYLQHLLIFPFGQLILTRRYGGTEFPTLRNQLFGFGTMVIYQTLVLTTLSDISEVNLNFTLCHSPADPFFKVLGYKYFLYAQLYLNIGSYICLVLMWPIKKGFYWLFFSGTARIKEE